MAQLLPRQLPTCAGVTGNHWGCNPLVTAGLLLSAARRCGIGCQLPAATYWCQACLPAGCRLPQLIVSGNSGSRRPTPPCASSAFAALKPRTPYRTVPQF